MTRWKSAAHASKLDEDAAGGCWSFLNKAEDAAREPGLQTLLAEVLSRRRRISIFVAEHSFAEGSLLAAFEVATTEKNRQL